MAPLTGAAKDAIDAFFQSTRGQRTPTQDTRAYGLGQCSIVCMVGRYGIVCGRVSPALCVRHRGRWPLSSQSAAVGTRACVAAGEHMHGGWKPIGAHPLAYDLYIY